MKEKSIELFRDAPVPKAVIANVVPSIVSMLMVLVYNLADTFFISQTKNAYMVAAVSLATPVFLIFMAIGLLFGIGGTSLISRMLGEEREEEAKNASAFCFWSGLTVGLISMVCIYLLRDKISIAVGASEDTLNFTSEYLRIVAIGIPFLIVSNSFSNIIRAEGKANVAMAGMIIGNLMNVILDPIMILGLKWNVAGAAIATVIGNVVAAIFYMVHLTSKKSMLSVNPKYFKIGDGIALGVLAIGVPASLNSMLMSVSNIVINNKMTVYGDMAIAGYGVAVKVNMIAVMLLIGVGSGIQPILGYCFGAKNKERFTAVLKFSLLFAFGLSIVMSAICYIGAANLVRIFLTDEAAFEYGFSFTRMLILSGPFLGILFVFINAIQSTGAALPSLILSISRQGLIYIPLLTLFSIIFHEARLLVLAQPVTDYLAIALSVALFIITYKSKFRDMMFEAD